MAVPETLKNIYRNDRFPLASSIASKELYLDFPELDLTVGTEQFAEDKGEFELMDSICSDGNLKFGKCNSAQVKFAVANVTDDINGKEFILTETVNDTYPVPFGVFTVESCPKQDDLIFKSVTAYDRMKKIDVDVAAWYNSLFPTGNETYTLAQFRASFLAYVGLTEDTPWFTLPNDTMIVDKTLDTTSLSGRTVIEAIGELNGVFGHISTEGKFEHIVLSPAYGDYPQNDYPQNDYPISADDKTFVDPDFIKETITSDMRENVRFEEYTVKEIDKLIIRTDADDIGAIVGTGSNAYIIQGNFLVYGKSAAELSLIAHRAYGYMAKRPYRPFESTGIGLPYLKVGDVIMHDQDDPVVSYVLKRTLTGIQALKDVMGATGAEQLPQNTSVNEEIKILKAKTTRITKTVEGVKVEVSDLAANTSAQIEILSDNIELKVDKAGVIASINLSPEAVTIKANKINFNGFATFDSNGNITTIDGSILRTGTVVADTVRSNWVYSNYINANQVSGGVLSGVKIKSEIALGRLEIEGAYIMTWDANGNNNLNIGYTGIIQCVAVQANSISIGGYAALHAGNIVNQLYNNNITVPSASRADYVNPGGYLGSFYISSGGGYISYAGYPKDNPSGYVYIGSQTVQAATIQQISMRESKENIHPYCKDALSLICGTPIRTYMLKGNKEDTKTHVGIIIDEAPEDVIGCGGKTVSLYDMISVAWKAIQQINERIS